MKVKNYFKYICLSFLFFSCNDDFLNVPNTGKLTDDSFWQSEEHVLEAITATYATLQSHTGSKWTFFEELYTSMNYKGDDVDNLVAEPYGRTLANFTYTTEASGPYNLWKTCYAGIGRANQVMQNVAVMDEVIIDAEYKQEIIAEMKFMRALFNFFLVTSFEDVPLVLRYEIDPDLLTPAKTPASDVWKQIEADLTEAEQYIPDAHPEKWAGRATKWTAKAYLAKAYLYQEKWAEAESKFQDVVENGPYDLLPNYEDNFNGKGENGPETVFDIQFSGDRSNGNDERHPFSYEASSTATGGWSLFYPTAWMVEEFKNDLTDGGKYSDRVYGSIFFDDPESEMYSLGTNEMVAYSEVKEDLNHPYFFKKFVSDYDENFYSGIDIPLMRFADVLLMYAEALNENGKTTEALTQVNRVRTRSNAAELSSMNQDELRTQIRHHERPVELAMEMGIRWYDLYRWGRGNTATESIKTILTNHDKPFAENFEENKHYLYPIPLQEININPNLEQNPNW
ncbi:RagB/SusD family nutrient uptake outer membrane protein [Rapidithrix thailandica]|uniref:RagB/SusD family nutrient uptake outer membrane protein n=1 Tax=Rapidithrix thailandica TaxID=413964 RepID=A0AAW9S9G7_9BACT